MSLNHRVRPREVAACVARGLFAGAAAAALVVGGALLQIAATWIVD
jgi:hypothetical protein